jgi:hypothetical protein
VLLLFKRNHFSNYLALTLLVLACVLPYVLFQDKLTLDNGTVLIHEVMPWSLPFIETPVPQVIYGFILIYIQALICSSLVIKNRMSRELSIIPSAVFILFSFLILFDKVYSQVLLANLFFCLSIRNLFALYKKHKPYGTIYNTGFFTGIAAILYCPYIVFLLFHILGIMSLRGLKVREVLQMLTGLLSPFFFLSVIYLYYDEALFHSSIISWSLDLPSIDLHNVLLLTKFGILLILCSFLFLIQPKLLKKKKFDVIKKIELSYWFFLFAVLSIFFTEKLSSEHLLIVSLPFSLLMGLHLEAKENVIVKSFVFSLFLLLYFALIFGIF